MQLDESSAAARMAATIAALPRYPNGVFSGRGEISTSRRRRVSLCPIVADFFP